MSSINTAEPKVLEEFLTISPLGILFSQRRRADISMRIGAHHVLGMYGETVCMLDGSHSRV